MADKIDLKKFADYFQTAPPKGSNAPPRTVPAKTLDKNFEKVTVVENDEKTDPKEYEVKYTDDGTKLHTLRGLPKKPLARRLYVCEGGEAKQLWFIVFDQAEAPKLPLD